MQSITSAQELKEEIGRLENLQAVQGKLLKEQLYLVSDSLRPVNVIKNTFREIFSSPSKMISGLLIAAAGLTTTYLVRKKSSKSNSSVFSKLAGVLLKSGLSAIISAKGNNLKETFFNLISKFFPANQGKTEA